MPFALPFPDQCRLAGLPPPVPELGFCDGRKWRFDFCWPVRMLALEVDGGGWTRGRHHRPKGYAKDCEKLNAAVLLGWRVLRVTPQMVASGAALELVRKALGKEKENG
jgi:very-short-patch-repair endonuclease